MKLSVCLEMLLTEKTEFARRVRESAALGLPAVEMWGWRNKDLNALEAALSESGAELVSFVSEPGGRLVDPVTHAEFLRGLRESIAVAHRLGTRNLIVLSGNTLKGVPGSQQHGAMVAALRAAAGVAEAGGVVLNLEPLNTLVDHPGYFLDATAEGLEVVEEVGSAHVRLLYDLYHSVVMGEDPREVLWGKLGLVGHVHIADHPGRHQPGSGGVPLETYLGWLEAQGYAGHVGLEFTPTQGSQNALREALELARRVSEQAPA